MSQREIDDLLEEQCDDAAEVDQLRQVINEVRATQPRPAAEPPWDQMAREIQAQTTGLPPTLWQRVRAAMRRPRVVAPALAAACAAVLLLVFFTGTSNDAPAPGQSEPAAVEIAPMVDDDVVVVEVDRRPENVEELASGELDQLLAELGPETMQVEEPVLPPEAVGDWIDPEAAPDAVLPDDEELELGLFAEPDYLELVDTLGEDELEAIEAFIASQTG